MSKKWKHDERELMKRSKNLFHDSLNMQWHWKGTKFQLYMNGELIWCSTYGNNSFWDTMSANDFANILLSYINSPLDMIIQNDNSLFPNNVWLRTPDELYDIMRSTDRRIGKRQLVIWLIIGKSSIVRKIAALRVMAKT